MKIDSAFLALPPGARLCAAAALGGLMLGVFVGFLLSGSSFRGSADRWDALPPLSDVPVENLAAMLQRSGLWDAEKGADSAAEIDLPGRPGAFKYLKLIAIIEDESRSAVMRISAEGREDIEKEGILQPVNGDLVQVRQGQAIFEGWTLAELGPTRLRFERAYSSAERGEGPDAVTDSVEYDLFGEF